MTASPMPKTAAEARKTRGALQAKRVTVEALLEASAERRKAVATAAEFGDTGAQDTLAAAVAEEAQTRTALENLDIVLADLDVLIDDLRERETEERERASAAELSDALDELLAHDDAIDDACDALRAMLEHRAELAASPVIRRGRGRFGGALVTESRQIGRSLQQYFADWLPNTGTTYAELTRIAEWDAHASGRESLRMAERPPREETMIEANMRRSTMKAVPVFGNGGFGYDSTVEAAKTRATVKDVIGGWPSQEAV